MPYNPNFGRVSLSPAQRQVTNFCPAPHNAPPKPFELGNFITDDGGSGEKLSYNGENHVCIFGKPGSGKDTRLLIPAIMQLSDRSVFAVDTPKGEMAAVTAPTRAKYGSVYILNFFGVLCDLKGYGYMEGCGFNPLCSIDTTAPDFNKVSGLLAEALIEKSAGEKQPFFPNKARVITSFCIMYECVKAAAQGRDPQLFNVRRMLCEECDEGIPPTVIGGEVVKPGTPPKGIPAYAREMANSPIIGLRNKAGELIKWTKSLNDAASTAQTETEFLDDPEMAYGLSRNDLDLRELKKRVMTVYLVLPPDALIRHSKFLRMALTIALNACQRVRAANEPRVVFFLNEFFSLGYLPLVENNYTTVRGAGIQMVLALHSIGQLKRHYGEVWETLLGSTDAICTFAPNDVETAEWFSKRSGETGKLKITVTENWAQNSGNTLNQGLTNSGETSGFGTSGGWSYSKTASHSYEKEPAVTTYDLYNMKPGEMRVIAANMGDTLHVHALPYYRRRKLLAETNPPVNPYAPDANIPRVAWQMPDYAAFQRQMLNAYQPIAIGHAGSYTSAPTPEEFSMSIPSYPAGNGDYVDNGTWDVLRDDPVWGSGDTAPQSGGGLPDSLPPPPAEPPRSLWLDDLEQTEIEKIINLALDEYAVGGIDLVEFLQDRRVACIATLDAWNEGVRRAELKRQESVQKLYRARLGRRATREEMNHNQIRVGELVAVTFDGFAHRLNPEFVDHKLLGNAIEYEDLGIPPYSEVMAAIKTAMEILDLEKLRLLPAPSASPAPTARNQELLEFNPAVQARHPAYIPEPPKHGGDDWAYADSKSNAHG